jgi:hypothetical protein
MPVKMCIWGGGIFIYTATGLRSFGKMHGGTQDAKGREWLMLIITKMLHLGLLYIIRFLLQILYL